MRHPLAVDGPALRAAMARGDAAGWLRAVMSGPTPAHALFATLGAERRALVALLATAAPAEAPAAIEEVEAFFDAVHAEACRLSRPGPGGAVVWPDAPALAPALPPTGAEDALALLVDTGRRLMAELDLRRLLPLLVERAATLVGAEVTLLAVWDPGRAAMEIVESRGLAPGMPGTLPIPAEVRLALADWPGARRHPRAELPWLAPFLAPELAGALVAPLAHDGALWGLLACAGPAVDAAPPAQLDLASVLAGQVAIAVRNAALYREALHGAAALRAANERLRGLDAMKDVFLATVSHELRTPLTWITGYGSMLAEDPGLDPERRAWAQRMLEGALHLRELLDDLLDYSRLQEGRLALDARPVDAAALVAEAVARFAPAAARAEVRLVAEAGAAPPLVADPERVGQVLGNLIANALKFTPAGGHVAVRLAALGDGGVRLAVRDTGPGVAPADQDRLFRRYGQVPTGTGRQAGGTGLGLAISKGLVEAHGGAIGVVSPLAEGRGSEFWFTLPPTGPPPTPR